MKKNLLAFFFLCISFTLFSQMYINDPQDWWGEREASVENVEIEVRTLGAYSETAIAFDILLSDPYFFGENDLLEFVFDFQLNDGAVVNDSWLWINDYISKGDVYEQGEGTQIYESIVDRQQDPSILTQLSTTDYNIKVYPLQWDSTRRIRLSYLEPLNFVGKKAHVDLPLGLLKHSEMSPENIKITIHDDINYSNDGLNTEDWKLEEEGEDFKVYSNNSILYPSDFVDIPASYSFKNTDSDYFLSTYEGVNDNYYQLVFFPDIDTENSQENRLIIFDFDTFSSEDSFEEVKEKFRTSLLSMQEEDQFIICHSDFITKFSSDEWMPATQENIEEALSKIDLTSVIIESRLSTLLPEALNKVEELNQGAEIILLSPNNEYYTEQKAKGFLYNMVEYYEDMQTEVSISILDYADSKSGDHIDGTLYYGNDYVYQNLVDETNGVYYSQGHGDDIFSNLSSLFTSTEIYTDQFEFQLSVEDGFTYSNFNNLKNEIAIGNGQPIISTGKYIGDGLFDVKFSAKVGFEVYTDIQKLDAKLNGGLDGMAETIWYSELIKSMQHSGADEDKRQVIETSIDKRLLSLHTVFLCLEPDFDSISANNNDGGNDILISTIEEDPDADLNFKVYPNPFVERLTIEFPIVDLSNDDQVMIQILDARGQLIERFTKTNGLIDGLNKIEWMPMYDLIDGMYIIQVRINDKMYNQKVIHVRS